jgi:hypothetical protein
VEQLLTFSKITGAILLLLGVIINYQIGRRRFYRRNAAGVQQFKSYRHSLLSRGLERILSILAYILMIAGVIILIGAFYMPAGIP